MTPRRWIVLGLVITGLGFVVFMATIPRLEEAQTLGRQLAAALDQDAAKQVARLRQQYYASIAVMVSGLIAVFFGLASLASRGRYEWCIPGAPGAVAGPRTSGSGLPCCAVCRGTGGGVPGSQSVQCILRTSGPASHRRRAPHRTVLHASSRGASGRTRRPAAGVGL